MLIHLWIIFHLPETISSKATVWWEGLANFFSRNQSIYGSFFYIPLNVLFWNNLYLYFIYQQWRIHWWMINLISTINKLYIKRVIHVAVRPTAHRADIFLQRSSISFTGQRLIVFFLRSVKTWKMQYIANLGFFLPYFVTKWKKNWHRIKSNDVINASNKQWV